MYHEAQIILNVKIKIVKYKQYFENSGIQKKHFCSSKFGSDIHITLSLLTNFSDVCFPFTEINQGL